MSDEKMDYKVHPLANLLPMLNQEELQSLANDIKVRGQRFGIVRWHGMIIDGRNRLSACAIAGIPPKIIDKDDALPDEKSVMEFIMSANLERRHLSASERAIIANEMMKMQEEMLRNSQSASPEALPANPAATPGEVEQPEQPEEAEEVPQPKPPRDKTKRLEAAAKKAGTSPAYVHEAKRIERESPQKYNEIKEGKKTISQARKEIKDESDEPLDEEKAYARAVKMVEKVQEKLEKLGYTLVQTKLAKL